MELMFRFCYLVLEPNNEYLIAGGVLPELSEPSVPLIVSQQPGAQELRASSDCPVLCQNSVGREGIHQGLLLVCSSHREALLASSQVCWTR